MRAGASRAVACVATLAISWSAALQAQDTTQTIDQGVRVGITYTAGVRPSIVVLPARGIDAALTILSRDLHTSDLFEVINLAPGDAPGPKLPSAAWNSGPNPTPINYSLYRTLGADYGVEVVPDQSGAVVRLHDLKAGAVRREQKMTLPTPDTPDFRMSVHRMADEVVRWATGTPGIAATRIAYVANRRGYRVDGDGADLEAIRTTPDEALSPAGSPTGQTLA